MKLLTGNGGGCGGEGGGSRLKEGVRKECVFGERARD